MASIKLILRLNRKKKDGRCPLRIQIIQNKKVSSVNLKNYSILESEWDEKLSRINKKHRNYKRLNLLINKKIAEVEERFLDLEIKNKTVSPDNLSTMVKGKRSQDFFGYAYEFMERYNNNEQRQTFDKYEMILNELKKFSSKKVMEFDEMNYNFFDSYLNYLTVLNKMPGTIHMRFNKIKAIWNSGTRSGKVDRNHYPFFNIKMPKIEKVEGKALTVKQIELIRRIRKIKGDSNIFHARNSFLFAYGCQGIRAGDLVQLKVGDCTNGRIEYKTGKSNKYLSILLFGEAKIIFEQYSKGKESKDYLFPWYEKIDEKFAPWRRKNTAVCLYNKNLGKIADLLEFKRGLTSHIARHSWAYHAKLKNIDTRIIRDALGHSDDKTTEAYLDRFPSKIMDDANRKVVGV